MHLKLARHAARRLPLTPLPDAMPNAMPNARRGLHPALWVLGIAGACGAPAAAQPDQGPTQGQALAQEAQARKAMRDWEELRAQVGDAEVLDPASAIERYRHFFEERASQQGPLSIAISLAIARLYWHELRDESKALEILDWTLQNFAALPGDLQPVQDDRDALLRHRQNPAAVPAPIHIAGTRDAPLHAPAVEPQDKAPGDAAAPPRAVPAPIHLKITAAPPPGDAPPASVKAAASATAAPVKLANPFSPNKPQPPAAGDPASNAPAQDAAQDAARATAEK